MFRYRYVQQCCKHEDLCNMNISLSFDDVIDNTSDIIAGVEDKKTIYMVITVLACVVVILATGCCVYIVNLSRVRNGSSSLLSTLPCLSQYTEVESKSCDTISTTTLQVTSQIFSSTQQK